MNLSLTQAETLQKLLRSRKSLMPHELCGMLHVKRLEAIAILIALMEQYPEKISHRKLIYCNCEENDNAPASASIPYSEEMPKTIMCSLCDDEITIDDAIGLDEIFVLKSAIYLKA